MGWYILAGVLVVIVLMLAATRGRAGRPPGAVTIPQKPKHNRKRVRRAPPV